MKGIGEIKVHPIKTEIEVYNIIYGTSIVVDAFVHSSDIKVYSQRYLDALIEAGGMRNVKFIGHRCINNKNVYAGNVKQIKIIQRF